MGLELASYGTEYYEEMADVDFSDSEVVSYVRDTLKSVAQGDTDRYNQLIGVMHHSEGLAPDEVALLVTSLKALSGVVSYVDIVLHEALLSSIFGMSMWNYGPDVVDALVELIKSLAVSNGVFVDSCLDMLVRNFMPPKSFISFLRLPRGCIIKDEVLNRVHAALTDIAYLVPLAPSRLLPIILRRMPNMFDNEALLVIYVESMFRLESSAIGELIGSTMLMAVVDRLVDLDVEIGWDEIIQEDASKGIFHMELEDVEETEDFVVKDGSKFSKGTMCGLNFGGNVVADKLDSLMLLTCQHLESCYDEGRLAKVFDTLLQSFRITILNAYKSKFAQFVMFYSCSLDPGSCAVRFANLLSDIFMCETHPPLTRMSAAAYLGSYLARAKFLSSSLISYMLKRLIGWCYKYIQIQDGEVKTINPEAHRIFYSGCQAVMYVLCFRMSSMVDVPPLKSQLFQMPLEQILHHPLDPLKVCLPSIVKEFLRQAKAARLFTVSENFLFSDLLESDSSKAFGGTERLDMFFPFDPCLLKKSDRFIRPNFVYWSMVRTTYDDDDEASGEEDDDNDDDDAARSFDEHGIDLDDFESSMNKMSITPKARAPMRMPAKIRPSTSPESL
ncbi:RNA polymerase I-specific transcription initiation factor RRN3 [Macadamia integrifolia]|uniref:RNA polymerase I-specific transcription initiation factor RRN3 n=1 Tax=Macadamia integrifolia TaxID=60698 RepID=UPI001C4F6120|nr:RNA polymerase I-specific transcription initiation factor RRN3 [Macadamia integrifolia]XP_042486746.1 RNA polymerase I-specific transcription initiation factor RRN3 [Macadamia integrifolia]XP_042486748.1 RNA polymerase I-specific transcription initiation factor RRN3 [Macadamia integrifolia]